MPSERARPLVAFVAVAVVCALVIAVNMLRSPTATLTAVEAAPVSQTGPRVEFGTVLAGQPPVEAPLAPNALAVALQRPVATAIAARPQHGSAPTGAGPLRARRGHHLPGTSRHRHQPAAHHVKHQVKQHVKQHVKHHSGPSSRPGHGRSRAGHGHGRVAPTRSRGHGHGHGPGHGPRHGASSHGRGHGTDRSVAGAVALAATPSPGHSGRAPGHLRGHTTPHSGPGRHGHGSPQVRPSHGHGAGHGRGHRRR